MQNFTNPFLNVLFEYAFSLLICIELVGASVFSTHFDRIYGPQSFLLFTQSIGYRVYTKHLLAIGV